MLFGRKSPKKTTFSWILFGNGCDEVLQIRGRDCWGKQSWTRWSTMVWHLIPLFTKWFKPWPLIYHRIDFEGHVYNIFIKRVTFFSPSQRPSKICQMSAHGSVFLGTQGAQFSRLWRIQVHVLFVKKTKNPKESGFLDPLNFRKKNHNIPPDSTDGGPLRSL